MFTNMKFSNLPKSFSRFLIVALASGMWVVLPADVRAADLEQTGMGPPFATPEEAVQALQTAAQSQDSAALQKVFGPEFAKLLTGDRVEDSNNVAKFALAMSQGCSQVKEGEGQITLELGTNGWPMPIPLVKTNGQWQFDTAAGKEEIINRHIGRDELYAIGVCRAYVKAQAQYAGQNQEQGGAMQYAQKFLSTPGMKDGLYWPAKPGEAASPLGYVVTGAVAEGYGHKIGTGAKPFYGYYFRVLTRQGDAAPGGKMDYMDHGKLTKGFALVAYPELWDGSGVMTFIVNQDGKVYQQNLGEKTAKIAGKMKEYNPDSGWTLEDDEGVVDGR